MMTQQLEYAFKRASKLPEIEQNIFAKFVIEELESEKKWEHLFSKSENLLETLATEAIENHKNGKTQKLDTTNL